MKYNLSLMMDPELHAVTKRYCFEKNISFARFVAECLIAVLGANGEIDEQVKERVEERIATHPGRRRLAPAPEVPRHNVEEEP